ncbi:hypothetical protein [Streptomyces sp. NPDC054842]
MRSTAESTVLAYKGLDGVPLWLVFGIAILAFIVFTVAHARKRK